MVEFCNKRNFNITLDDGAITSIPVVIGQGHPSTKNVWDLGSPYLTYINNEVQMDGNTTVAIWASGTGGHSAGECTSTYPNLQADGNLVIYTVNPIWASNTGDRPSSDTYRLELQNDGNLTIIDTTTGQNIWYSGSGGHPTNDSYSYAEQSDGNLVVYQKTAIWASGTGITPTNPAGHPNARLVMQSDGNLVIYNSGSPIWASNTSGEQYSGATCVFQDDGNLVIYKKNPVTNIYIISCSDGFGITTIQPN